MSCTNHWRRARGRLLLLLALALPFAAQAATTLTRTSSFAYDPTSGLLTKEIIEPNTSAHCLVTEYALDGWGNKTGSTVRNCNGSAGEAWAPFLFDADYIIEPRTTRTTLDARGQFPVTSTNALNQSETDKTHDPRFGALTGVTGPNGMRTQWQYDDFGRKTLETRADGTQTQWSYHYCSGVEGGTVGCPTIGGAQGKYLVVTTPLAANGTQNGPIVKTYYDALNREIRSETQGFDGSGTSTAIYKDTQYDSLGRPYKTSRPYYAGQTAYWTTLDYDALDRPVVETRADNTQTRTQYCVQDGRLKVTVTNALGQIRTTFKNSQGNIVKVTDALNNTLQFTYDPFGNLTTTQDALGNITRLSYNIRGHKTQMVDPDMGTWTYVYNPLGELVKQGDAKWQISTMAYDKLGRMRKRTEADLISEWYYDANQDGSGCGKGIGKLCEAKTSTGYLRRHVYDPLGRPGKTTTTLDTTYEVNPAYDSNSRLATQSYPSGLTLKYVYTPRGYLQEIRDNTSNALYWRADNLDAEAHLRQQTTGNNVITQQIFDPETGRLTDIFAGAGNGVQSLHYAYDAIGNLQSRSDANQSLTESFLYDGLNRLESSTVNSPGAGIVTKTYVYDALGNIQSRSDLGVYAYNPSGSYSVRPHAVTQVTLHDGGRRTYAYDGNGNLTNEAVYGPGQLFPSKTRTENYTSFNMPISMGTTGLSLAFYYGPEHQRVKQISSAQGTTYYLNPGNSGELLYEKDVKPDGTLEERNFITAYGQVVAVVKLTTTSAGPVWSVRYLHRDNLGSVTAVTDENGAVVERLGYEPFGKRRFETGADDGAGSIVPQTTDRGFTNHEHLDELGLIHMNGRVYDPTIGRFMSADFLVPDPYDMQSYNRYAYVLNNPLIYTDADGQNPFVIAAIVFGTVEVAHRMGLLDTSTTRQIQGIAVAVMVPGAGLQQALVSGLASGFVASDFNLQGGMYGAMTAGLFNAAGTMADSFGGKGTIWANGGLGRAGLHAGAGCISGHMQGGSCGRSALAAGFSEAMRGGHDFKGDKVAGTVAHAVVGGTASVIGGGNFANGAQMGAFGYLFNQEMHEVQTEPPFPGAVLTRDPITGKPVWVHRDFIDEVANYAADPTLAINANAGGEGNVFAGVVGFSASAGPGVDMNFGTCFAGQACLQVGLGGYIGGGVSAGAGLGSPLTSGRTDGLGFFYNAGPHGGNVSFSSDGLSGARGFFGGGMGVSAGTQFCQSYTVCR